MNDHSKIRASARLSTTETTHHNLEHRHFTELAEAASLIGRITTMHNQLTCKKQDPLTYVAELIALFESRGLIALQNEHAFIHQQLLNQNNRRELFIGPVLVIAILAMLTALCIAFGGFGA